MTSLSCGKIEVWNPPQGELYKGEDGYSAIVPRCHETKLFRCAQTTYCRIAIALAIISFLGVIAVATSPFSSEIFGSIKHFFSQQFIHFSHHIHQLPPWQLTMIGTGIVGVVLIGVYYGYTHKKEPDLPLGRIIGNAHWKSLNGRNHNIDTSTLTLQDGKYSGTAYVYYAKSCRDHYHINFWVSTLSAVYLPIVLIYNCLRVVILPLMILACMAAEKVQKKSLFPERYFKFSDIGEQCARSIWNIVRAPFYWLGFVLSIVYSCIPGNARNGRKLGAYFERKWNDCIPPFNGWILEGGPQKGARPGLHPNWLGKTVFYIPLCWQPAEVWVFKDVALQEAQGIMEITEGEVKKYYSLPQAIAHGEDIKGQK